MNADRIDPERRRLREGAAQKPKAALTPEERSEWRALKTAQRAFQKQCCPSCIHWRQGGFRRTGHQNDAADCFWHWTDVMGACWNYRLRPTPWYDAVAAYCAARCEWYWRAASALARCVSGIIERVRRC